MKKKAEVFLIFIFITLGLVSLPRGLAQTLPLLSPMTIRVRIAQGIAQGTVRGFDLRIFETQKSGLKLAASSDKTSEWEFRCKAGQIRLRSLNGPQKNHFALKEPVSIQTPAGFLNFEDQPYRDGLKIYSTGVLCEVVNEVDFEKYLDGLVNSEFSSQWSEEAVAAQVVAARTYGLYQIQEARGNQKSHFDLNATTRDQVYNGSLKEDYHSSRAVEKTRGLILTVDASEKSPPIKAFYHSTCGGKTELPEDVWSKKYPGFQQRVSCPYCAGSPRYQWSLELTTPEIVRAIENGIQADGLPKDWPKEALSIVKKGSLLDIRVHPLTRDARKNGVITSWAEGKKLVELTLPAVRWRDWIGVTRVKSTAFEVLGHSNPAGIGRLWSFSGRGNGHGVGLCQWGAKGMGEKGFKMAAILKFYYPDAVLKKLW